MNEKCVLMCVIYKMERVVIRSLPERVPEVIKQIVCCYVDKKHPHVELIEQSPLWRVVTTHGFRPVQLLRHVRTSSHGDDDILFTLHIRVNDSHGVTTPNDTDNIAWTSWQIQIR